MTPQESKNHLNNDKEAKNMNVKMSRQDKTQLKHNEKYITRIKQPWITQTNARTTMRTRETL